MKIHIFFICPPTLCPFSIFSVKRKLFKKIRKQNFNSINDSRKKRELLIISESKQKTTTKTKYKMNLNYSNTFADKT